MEIFWRVNWRGQHPGSTCPPLRKGGVRIWPGSIRAVAAAPLKLRAYSSPLIFLEPPRVLIDRSLQGYYEIASVTASDRSGVEGASADRNGALILGGLLFPVERSWQEWRFLNGGMVGAGCVDNGSA